MGLLGLKMKGIVRDRRIYLINKKFRNVTLTIFKKAIIKNHRILKMFSCLDTVVEKTVGSLQYHQFNLKPKNSFQ